MTFLAVFLSALLSVVLSVRAEGTISAVSFLPVPVGSTILVRPLDNSDSNLILQKDFERALKDYSAVLAAMLLAVSIPPFAPWWVIIIGTFFAIGIGIFPRAMHFVILDRKSTRLNSSH